MSRPLDDEAPRGEDADVPSAARGGTCELMGQLSLGLPDAEEDALAPLVQLGPRVVECVHREVREDEEVGAEVCALEDVREERAEVMQVDVRVHEHEELRERELALTEDPEGALHRLALVPLFDSGG